LHYCSSGLREQAGVFALLHILQREKTSSGEDQEVATEVKGSSLGSYGLQLPTSSSGPDAEGDDCHQNLTVLEKRSALPYTLVHADAQVQQLDGHKRMLKNVRGLGRSHQPNQFHFCASNSLTHLKYPSIRSHVLIAVGVFFRERGKQKTTNQL